MRRFPIALSLFALASCAAQAQNLLADGTFDQPITSASTWVAGTNATGVWYALDHVSTSGYAEMTYASSNYQQRVLLQAIPMPAAGTYTYSLRTRYTDYWYQYHYWHIIAVDTGASISLGHESIMWDLSKPLCTSATRHYGWDGTATGDWVSDHQTFQLAPSIADSYDYLIVAFVTSKRSTDVANWDDIVLEQDSTWGTPLFEDVSSSLGFARTTTTSADYGSSPLAGDLNADGRMDFFLSGQTPYELLQNANGVFATQVLPSTAIRRQCALADLDNDGDLDIWSANVNSYDVEGVFWNNGTGGFTHSAGTAMGFGDPTNNEAMALADVDADGFCDVVHFSANGNWVGINASVADTNGVWGFTAENSTTLGLLPAGGFGNGDYASTGDVNNDTLPDFFYHYNSGTLFLSQTGGPYTLSTGGISVATGESDKMGSAWGDYDNDGDLDLFVARRDSGGYNYLWKNNSDGTFTDIAQTAGIDSRVGNASGAWGDYDNDGDLDLLVVAALGTAHSLYENQGDGTFVEVAGALPVCLPGTDGVFTDYDNDGDLDIAITHVSGTSRLFRNSTNGNASLRVRVLGGGRARTNRAGAGVRVDLYNAAGTILLARRDIGVARGLGQEPLWAHFGGLDESGTYLVRAHLLDGPVDVSLTPSDATTTIGSVTMSRALTISENAANLSVVRWVERDPE